MLTKRTGCLRSRTMSLRILLTIILFMVSLGTSSGVAANYTESTGSIRGDVTTGQIEVAQKISTSANSSELSTATSTNRKSEYAIGAGDVLSIKVYDHEELTVKVRVSERGVIEFPLIGEVHVGGLGIRAAAKRIETGLGDGYIVEPQVTIFVEQFKSKKVVVFGPVHSPGLIELNASITLLELISKVGGLKDNAGQTATIKRQENGTQKNILIDLERLIRSGDPQENIEIQGGDTVSIAEGAVCFVTGEVNQPGEYPCGQNTTLLKIISQAGSFTEKALESGVRINRVVNGRKRIVQNVNMDTLVQPDDVIIVPVEPDRLVSKQEELLCYISGEVKRPGAYPCSRRTSILKLLTRAGGFTENALESGMEINRQLHGRKRVIKNVNKDTLLHPEDVVVVPASAAKKEAVCYITGQVNRPGAYPCGRNTTVLKMVSLAGSFTGIAAESSIKINRVVNGKKQVLKDVEHDTLLLPEDVIVVPESFF
ncbi:MAG: hypothetical protein D3909_00965 [Candidatus Electrothrix sp. ATG1]|nr:hypothetical protein [Candidatus Electrothrix sp. ATG1]